MLLDDPLFYLIAAAMAAVVVVLLLGLFSFARGGEFNRRHANRLMRWRVGMQAVAVALIVLFALIRHTWKG